MKHIKTYMGVCLGSLLMTLSSCEPNMDYNNPLAENEATYYNTKEHLIYAVNGAYNILQRAGGWARWMPFMLNARSDEYVFTSGATQREVKLEITGNQNDELIKYLDDILLGLRYQDGHYNLVKLNDEEYQGKLKIQSDYWDKLKTEIEAVRNKGYENTDIVNMSEIYFTMADETVSAAESYSEKIAIKIRTIELLSALDMLILVILVIMQTLKAMQMAMQNRLLEQKAFVDAHTGLPNKNACNELLNKKDIITGSTACIMFNINYICLFDYLFISP